MLDTCEIVTSHVALERGDADETIDHIVTICGAPAVAVVDDDDDDVTVCAQHIQPDAVVVKHIIHA